LTYYKNELDRVFDIAKIEVMEENNSENPRIKSSALRDLLIMFRGEMMSRTNQIIWASNN